MRIFTGKKTQRVQAEDSKQLNAWRKLELRELDQTRRSFIPVAA